MQAGLSSIYIISNANKTQDLFTNPVQVDYITATASGTDCDCTRR